MKAEYTIGISLLVLTGIGAGALYLSPAGSVMRDRTGQVQSEPYKEIVNPAGFVNTDGITIGELIGKKVVLVDFLTYSCINCQRTFPYLNDWYDKYKDQGLEIIGIHTPEFAFEKDIDNVRTAMKKFGITHPIVLDNDYSTWRAYANRYWPRKYLIDITGKIVYDHIGEGAYEETEAKIVELLQERAQVLGVNPPLLDEKPLVSDSISANNNRSPETYFGSARNESLANGVVGKSGLQSLVIPRNIITNALYLAGQWIITAEYAESIANNSVVFRYNAKEVYIVASAETATTMQVFHDGQLVTANRGEDVNSNGVVTVRESRLYKLISNEDPGEHTLEIRIGDKKIQLFAFTFG